MASFNLKAKRAAPKDEAEILTIGNVRRKQTALAGVKMTVARKSSLGPFPKQFRWLDVVSDEGSIAEARKQIAALSKDPELISALVCFVGLVVASRSQSPGPRRAGLPVYEEAPELRSPVQRGLRRTFKLLQASSRLQQTSFDGEDCLQWVAFDSAPAFTDFARLLFACQIEEVLFDLAILGDIEVNSSRVPIFAQDITQIVVSFTARWFSSCVANKVPSRQVVRWYLGHCLGKLDMELEREIDPTAFIKRPARQDNLQLDLGLEL